MHSPLTGQWHWRTVDLFSLPLYLGGRSRLRPALGGLDCVSVFFTLGDTAASDWGAALEDCGSVFLDLEDAGFSILLLEDCGIHAGDQHSMNLLGKEAREKG